jgi:type IV pilus assembly protein PilM
VTALVDVGASKTSVNVMRGNSSLFTREIHAAGDAFTAAIASRLNLKQAEAEALKQQPGAEQEHMRAAVAPAVEDLSNEVRLSFDYFENQFDRAIDEVLLSGGGARLLGLPQDLARALGKPATTWDPTGDLPIAAGAVDVDILRGRVTDLAVAVGLASRVQP